MLVVLFLLAIYSFAETTAAQRKRSKAPASSNLSSHKMKSQSAARKSRGLPRRASSAPVQSSKSPGRSTSTKRPGKKIRGQAKIDPERAQSIQEALIREHFMNGEPTGTWNQDSEDAMRRYQAAHGWQSKTVPDSRALISLGLGPSHERLLNPESAMTTGPDVSHSASASSSGPLPVSSSSEPRSGDNSIPSNPQNDVPEAPNAAPH